MSAVRATRATRRWHGDDSGFTLVEVLVSTAIMAIVMALVTAGVLTAGSTLNHVDAGANSQTQVHQAFDQLDVDVRWASGITAPGSFGGDSYVEYLSTYTSTAVCHELRWSVSAGQLQARQWNRTTATPRPTPWHPLASGVTDVVFTANPPPTTMFAQLRIEVTAKAGGAAATASATSVSTFTAHNSTGVSLTTDCTEGRQLP